MESIIIIEALEDKYNTFDGSEEVKANTIFWLYNHLNPNGIEDEIVSLHDWLVNHNRCLKCGGQLFTTYKKDTTTNPPTRQLYSFCLSCEG